MAEPPAQPTTTDAEADRPPTIGPPRWVRVSVVVVAALILLIVVLVLVGGGSHGPGRHG